MVCRRAVLPGEFTCGEEACEVTSLAGQTMLAALSSGQEVGTAKKARFPASLPSANAAYA